MTGWGCSGTGAAGAGRLILSFSSGAGAGLAAELGGAVESSLHGVLPAAHHAEHRAGAGVQAGHGALGLYAVGGRRGKKFALGVLRVGNLLIFGVQSGIDMIAAALQICRGKATDWGVEFKVR